jgi:hypothetical protein
MVVRWPYVDNVWFVETLLPDTVVGALIRIYCAVAATQLSNSTLTAANALIQLLSQDYILSPDITTSACWADDLKAMGVGQFSIW